MSQRSVCEFNHDYAHYIERNPEMFCELLRRALAGGDKESWEELGLRFGLKRIIQRHHSDDGEVVLKFGKYRLP